MINLRRNKKTKVNRIINNNIIKDIDGNVYNIIKIGDQYWTIENLKTTRYNDGTLIPYITNNNEWENNKTGAYCYYGNNINNKQKYGALYNWYAMNTGKLAPKGWQVPTDADWEKLEQYLIVNGYNWDGSSSGDKIAKSMAAKTAWGTSSNNGDIGNDLSKNNKSGFSALPGGYRYVSGHFNDVGSYGHWWSATENSASHAYYRNLTYYYEGLIRDYHYKWCGFSVRLIRDK